MNKVVSKSKNIIKTAQEDCVRSMLTKKTYDSNQQMTIVRQMCAKHKVSCLDLKKSNLLEVYQSLIIEKNIKEDSNLRKSLIKRKIRTQSGVSVISVMTKPLSCPGNCIYCPSQKDMPKSYLDNQPAAMRGVMFDFDPYEQVWARLTMLKKMGHDVSKNEVIVLGGTFSAHPRKYQEMYIKRIFDAFNSFGRKKAKIAKNLLMAKKINEKADCRCIGLTIETRPDYINYPEVAWLRYLGVTRVELGVQSVFDDVLKKVRRNHDIAVTCKATRILRQAGFKIVYHMMPGLPGSSPKRDLEMFKILFTDTGMFPDHLKIYPTVVLEDSELFEWWKNKKYKPYTRNQLMKLLLEIKKVVPPWVRIVRLMRDIPKESIVAGVTDSNLRQLLEKQSIKCVCIRCREPKNCFIKSVKEVVREYGVAGGKEHFVSYESVDEKNILALARIFLPNPINKNLLKYIPELKGAAIIRELHTYGTVVEISKKNKNVSQHRGLGKKLMLLSESIAVKNGFKKMAVIAGVGVREYYAKLGYRLKGEYMIKNLV